jgi:Glycosyl transferase family 2
MRVIADVPLRCIPRIKTPVARSGSAGEIAVRGAGMYREPPWEGSSGGSEMLVIGGTMKTTRPVLGTVILSWNRPELLARTISSYVATTTVPNELWIVDNGSGEQTRAVLLDARHRLSSLHVLLLHTNVGGEALNPVLADLRTEYVHVSENDLEYRPGWDVQMLRKFAAFPQLGQLSPFSPCPEVAAGEIGEARPATPVEANGERIYLAKLGITTSRMMRRALLDAGLRWRNIESGSFRWPNDAAFSADCKALGYQVAWNDRYVATNLGQNLAVINANPNYYLSNYRHKPWLGVEALRQRVRRLGAGWSAGVDEMLTRIDAAESADEADERRGTDRESRP